MKNHMLAILAAVAALFLAACQQQTQETGTCYVDGKYGGAQTTTAQECEVMNGRFEG